MIRITAAQAAVILGRRDGPAAQRALARGGVHRVGRNAKTRKAEYDLEQVTALAENPPAQGPPRTRHPNLGTVHLALPDRAVDVELGRLTPHARALAEVLAAQLGGEVGCAAVLESVHPWREFVPADDADMYPADQLDRPATMLWRSWSPWRPGANPPQDIVWWLEYEAAQIPDGFVAIRPLHADRSWRAPSADLALVEPPLLTRDQALVLLRRLGCHVRTEDWFKAQRAGRVPGPQFIAGDPRWRRLDIVISSIHLATTATSGSHHA